MLTDLRHALRFMLANPAFAAAAALTLALGIGANTAMFSVVREVLLRPLPYETPDRLVKVWETWGETRNVIAPANFFDWQARNRSFEQLAAFVPGAANLGGTSEPERVPAAHVTANFFDVLKIAPVAGRLFTVADEAPNVYVALLRESFWRSRFASDPGVVGRPILLDGVSYDVVGIVPDRLEQPSRDTVIWRPLHVPPPQRIIRGAHYLQAVARLREGVSVGQADEDLRAIAAELSRQFPRTNDRVGARVFQLQDDIVRNSRPMVLVVFAATGVLLLLACVNVAHLLLARGSARQVELAVRAAIGASRGRLVRQLLSEGLVIALAGTALGLLIAMWAGVALRTWVPDAFADVRRARVDVGVLLFSLAATIGTVILFGLVPALRLSRASLGSVTRTQITHVTSRTATGRTLIVLQVALAVVLVVGAGLLLNTLLSLRSFAPAYATEDLVVARVPLTSSRYSDAAAHRRFFEQLLERLRGVPGVQDAAVATRLPLRQQSAQMTFTVDTTPRSHLDGVVVQEMSPSLPRLLGIPVLLGRPLEASDSMHATNALVSRTFAMRAWGTADVIGRRFRMGPTYIDEGHAWMTVVGVLDDVRQFSLAGRTAPQVYLPFGQPATSWAVSEVVVRTSLAPPDAFAAIRAAVRELDRDQPVTALSTMAGVVERTLASPRFTALLVGIFAALAVALALVGIYGVISYAVTRRTREIGVRLALGARRGDVLRMVAGEGLALVAVGLAAGLASAAVASRSLDSLLFGVAPLDPVTYVAAGAVMLLTALLASVLPTLRATRVDPATVLRSQ